MQPPPSQDLPHARSDEYPPFHSKEPKETRKEAEILVPRLSQRDPAAGLRAFFDFRYCRKVRRGSYGNHRSIFAFTEPEIVRTLQQIVRKRKPFDAIALSVAPAEAALRSLDLLLSLGMGMAPGRDGDHTLGFSLAGPPNGETGTRSSVRTESEAATRAQGRDRDRRSRTCSGDSGRDRKRRCGKVGGRSGGGAHRRYGQESGAEGGGFCSGGFVLWRREEEGEQ
ncbi:hypothetical protein AXG93_2116s1270 [Marchantia polymorpha subsp. ruderalis]|uniref:Uncharacterized protein n=1 Tax=Marchantia polymorpha subsp. ruderalis TaxID=1480154 RepID=A0A176VMF0_MARPO|nr:hypothetical protein AXG93_2116s1270 [Marchantia polymorpha subsp. ruderalis]